MRERASRWFSTPSWTSRWSVRPPTASTPSRSLVGCDPTCACSTSARPTSTGSRPPIITVRHLARFAHSHEATPPAQPLEPLTVREEEILLPVARGRTNSEITDELHISISTVKTHLAALMRKLNARNRVEIAIWAHETRRAGTGRACGCRSRLALGDPPPAATHARTNRHQRRDPMHRSLLGSGRCRDDGRVRGCSLDAYATVRRVSASVSIRPFKGPRMGWIMVVHRAWLASPRSRSAAGDAPTGIGRA